MGWFNVIIIFTIIGNVCQSVYAASKSTGQAFTELESDNAKFKLKIEQEDDLIHGHLVLYHVVDADYQIQLWTSDYSTNGSNAVITEEGDLIIYDGNQTNVVWTAPLNESSSCIATTLVLTDTAELNLKCADGTITWSAEGMMVYDADIDVAASEPCFFLDSAELVDDYEKKYTLSMRCLKFRSSSWVYGFGQRSISVDDFKCGVRNATTVELVSSSALCFSDSLARTVTAYIHAVRFVNENFYKDYFDVRKKRFKARKLEIEQHWTAIYLNSTAMMDAGFESAIILSMSKPENETLSGLIISAIVQFTTDFDKTDYEAEWNVLTSNNQLYNWLIDDTNITDPYTCQSLSTIKPLAPADIWTATALDGTVTPRVGTTINLVCPDGLKISNDDDGYNAFDDKYTILCTTRQTYDVPRKAVDWPTCVQSCWMKLPYQPLAKTGLISVDAVNTVPSGKSGQYMCEDPSLGVDRGPSEYFDVLCNEIGQYIVPPRLRDWPICMGRTTTMSPVLPIALRSYMKAITDRLVFRLEAYAWTDTENPPPPPVVENHFVKICLPAVAVMFAFVICVLCSIRIDSPFCKICEDKSDDRFVKKKKLPLDDEFEENDSITEEQWESSDTQQA